jgi:hypothetical protein
VSRLQHILPCAVGPIMCSPAHLETGHLQSSFGGLRVRQRSKKPARLNSSGRACQGSRPQGLVKSQRRSVDSRLNLGNGGPPQHACRRSQAAANASGPRVFNQTLAVPRVYLCPLAFPPVLQWTKPIRDNKFAEIRKYLDIIPAAAAAANCGYQRNLGHKMNREWAAATCRILQPHGMSDKCPPNWRHSKKAQYLWVLGQQLGLHVSLHSGLPRHAKRCG